MIFSGYAVPKTAAHPQTAAINYQQPTADLTFGELFFRWRSAVVPTLRPATARYYEKMLSCHVLPVFRQYGIKDISRYHVERFLADKASAYCRATLRGMRVSLGQLLSWAVAVRWLEENPCAGVKLPRAPNKVRRTVLTPEQVIALSAKLEEPCYADPFPGRNRRAHQRGSRRAAVRL